MFNSHRIIERATEPQPISSNQIQSFKKPLVKSIQMPKAKPQPITHPTTCQKLSVLGTQLQIYFVKSSEKVFSPSQHRYTQKLQKKFPRLLSIQARLSPEWN